MYRTKVGGRIIVRWGLGVLGLALLLMALVPAQAQAPAPVRRALVGPRPWTQSSTDRSPEFVTKPALVENLPGEPFTVAKEAPTVDFAVYPEQINPLAKGPGGWSEWGEGCIAPDGCFYSAVGDHGGPDAETFIYQFDPEAKAVRKVFSFMALMGHQPGDWGYGKIHSRLCVDREGWIYFAGYWGNYPKEKDLNERYDGGVIARYNIYSGIAEHFGSPVAGVSWPRCELDEQRGLLYLMGTDNSFACYDFKAGALKYHGSQDITQGARGPLVDTRDGAAYFSAFSANSPEGVVRLAKYDPASNTVSLTKAVMPAEGGLRAATVRRAADGWFYCMTFTGRLFRFKPETEEVEDLGFNFGEGHYTTCIGLSPGGHYLYYVPGAHGTCAELGTPLVQYDIRSRQRKVVAFLEAYFESKHNYQFWGTYSVTVSPDGSTVFIPINGGIRKPEGGTEGAVALLAVRVPESEREE